MKWVRVPLHEVATIERSGIDPGSLDGEIPYVGLENIEAGGALIGVNPVSSGDLKSTKFSFTKKHVLYGKLRPYLSKIALPDFDGICSTDILPILPGARLDRNYICHYLRQPSMVEYAASRSEGANLPRLSPKTLANLEIPLPPLDEQKRIAAILDKADALRRQRRQALTLLDSLTQSIFLEMFGDPVSNPNGWREATLGEVISQASDGPHVSPVYSESGVPFLSTRHVQRGKIVWSDLKHISESDAAIHWRKCRPMRGDIIYTKGGTTGIAAHVDFDTPFAIWVHVALLKIKHDIVKPKWLECMLNSQYCYAQSQRYTHGIANRDLGLKRMIKIKLFVPPIEKQVDFADRCMMLDKMLERSNVQLKEAESLFSSLQHRAFSGQL